MCVCVCVYIYIYIYIYIGSIIQKLKPHIPNNSFMHDHPAILHSEELQMLMESTEYKTELDLHK